MKKDLPMVLKPLWRIYLSANFLQRLLALCVLGIALSVIAKYSGL